MAEVHGHDHGAELNMPPAPLRVRRIIRAIILPLVIATLVCLVALWPRGEPAAQGSGERVVLRGKVESATPPCPQGQAPAAGGPCGTARVRVGGQTLDTTVPAGPGAPEIGPGDRVVVAGTSGDQARFAVVDHDRSLALLFLLALFAAAVIAFARWRGVASLAGLGISFAVLFLFILPAIARGEAPLAVAIVGSATIMFAVIYLTHGVSVSTSVAVLGTLVALVLTGLLGQAVTLLMRLTGTGTEEATILSNVLPGVDLRGLLLAGIIIGTLGVLDDVTITQTSIVNELSRADPGLSGRGLYTSALRVGRAHVASVVNTIVLAYAGASLPLMLILVTGGGGALNAVTTQAISAEIVRSVVGTLGLISAVPVTTALAAWISVKRRISD